MTLRAVLCSSHSCSRAHMGSMRPWVLIATVSYPFVTLAFPEEPHKIRCLAVDRTCGLGIWVGGHLGSHEDKWMA